MNYKKQMLKGIERIVDDDALTVNDIIAETGQPRNWVSEYANRMVETGRWERVWRHGPTRIIRAYRPVRRRST